MAMLPPGAVESDFVITGFSAEMISISSVLTAFETFDASEVVDPVVVSGVFWTSLKAKLLSLVIGQVLAVIVFGIITALAAQQIQNLTESIFKNFPFLKPNPDSTNSFRTMPDLDEKRPVSPDFFKLLICVAVDSIGTSSELVPFFGEIADVAWAPIAALILRSLFGSNDVVFVLEFVEEILPFTDFLPLATICWVVDTFFAESDLARLLQVGSFGRVNLSSKGVIDVLADNDSDSERRLPGRDKDSLIK